MNSAGTQVFRRGVKLNSYNVFWWLQTYTLLSLFEVKICYTEDVYPPSCPVGLFGVNCAFYCHCKPDGSRCNVDGQCLGGTPCEPGYFGAGCQYVDMCKENCAPSVPSYLRDDNDSTCNTDASSTNVTISLTWPHIFTWFRLYINDASEIHNFDVKINDHLQCQGERRVLYNDRTVDVMCDNLVKLKNITLSGSAVKKLCEIDINGGRAVSWFQPASQSSRLRTSNVDGGNANNVVSTKDNLAKGLCTRTEVELSPYWQVDFNRPQVISEIRIVKRSYLVVNSDFIWLLKNGSQTISSRTFSQNRNVSSSYVFESGTFLRATNIRVTVVSGGVLDSVGLCQVEALGETVCPDGTWGFGCEKNCSCPKFETCSVVTGVCHQPCRRGFYGMKCFLPCPQICTSLYCTQRCGDCITVCPPTVYGDNCNRNCSSQCKDSLCDASNGNCTECGWDRYGNDCSKLCPSNCKNYLCHRLTGQCQECVRGHFGVWCNQSCPKSCENSVCSFTTGLCLACKEGELPYCADCPDGKYGNNCTKTCPSVCADQKCTFENGHCLACANGLDPPLCTGCRDGFWGTNCSKDCPTFCKEEDCLIDTGHCKTCRNKHKPPHCNNCRVGFFWTNCSSVCPEYCKRCEYDDGICTVCKDEDEEPPHCNVCPIGSYGRNCSEVCPDICKYGLCSKIGLCTACQNGLNPPQCTGCRRGMYGIACDKKCPERCFEICDRFSGICFRCKNLQSPPHCAVAAEPEEAYRTLFWTLVAMFAFLLALLCILSGLFFKIRRAEREVDKESNGGG